MVVHSAEKILLKVLDLLMDLETTGESVQRSRVYDWADSELPALSIYMGSDSPGDPESRNIAFSDWELEIRIEAVCKKLSYSETDSTLNAIRGEVAAALLSDYTLGLSFVIDVIEGEAGSPNESGESERPTASQVLTYSVKYRRPLKDPRI